MDSCNIIIRLFYNICGFGIARNGFETLAFLDFSDFYPKFIDYQHDLKDAEAILQNKLGKIETLKILKAKQADYIYIDKSVYGSHELDEEFAEKVFDNPKIRIYKVKSGAL